MSHRNRKEAGSGLEVFGNGLGSCPMADFGICGVKTSGSVTNRRGILSINFPDVSSTVCDVPSTLWSLNQLQNIQREHIISTYKQNVLT